MLFAGHKPHGSQIQAPRGRQRAQRLLRWENPDLAAQIDARFEDVEQELHPYPRDDGWVSYEKVDENERRELSQKSFGFASRKPAALEEIPDLPGDNLDPDLSGGDVCVQACADDPQVAFHAVRNLARIGRGAAVIRWSQLGFSRTSSTSSAQKTPRNLMGFKDGTNNIRAEDEGALDRYVWARTTA